MLMFFRRFYQSLAAIAAPDSGWLPPASGGVYAGGRYFGPRYFGARYFASQ